MDRKIEDETNTLQKLNRNSDDEVVWKETYRSENCVANIYRQIDNKKLPFFFWCYDFIVIISLLDLRYVILSDFDYIWN